MTNETAPAPVVGILLAAGAGSRFGNGVNPGGGKLLHEIDGVAIGVRAARHLIAAGLPVTAVVRPGSGALASLLAKEGVTVTECANAAEGMGVSLAHAISTTSHAAGWVVTLADMPHIQPETIRKIAESVSRGAMIAAPEFHGMRGHPVGFAATLRDELLALSGDEGARAMLKRHHAEIELIAVDDSGVVFDIDRKEDIVAPL